MSTPTELSYTMKAPPPSPTSLHLSTPLPNSPFSSPPTSEAEAPSNLPTLSPPTHPSMLSPSLKTSSALIIFSSVDYPGPSSHTCLQSLLAPLAAASPRISGQGNSRPNYYYSHTDNGPTGTQPHISNQQKEKP